jgi:MFS family permease
MKTATQPWTTSQSRHETNTATILAAACLIAVAFAGSTVITPVYPLFQRTFGFSNIVLTLIYSAYIVGNVVALLFFGQISDRSGRRRVALAALAAAGVGILSFLFATNTVWLFCGRALMGAAVGIASGTATAWLVELYGSAGRSHATIVAACANFAGIAFGPLIAGILVQYAPLPLRLPFIVYLVALSAVAVVVARGRETVRDVQPYDKRSIRPRIGVPADVRGRFIVPAVTAFGCFAFGGFYFALMPSTLIEVLHEHNLAIGGAIVFELSAVGAAVIVLSSDVESRASMLTGLALLLPALAAFVAAQSLRSMPALIAGTAIGGVAMALGYRGSLQVVNEIAPSDHRAAMVSSYYLVCFVGNSLPVIGVGILAAATTPLVASEAFAATIAIFVVAAIVASRRGSEKLRTGRG